MEEWFETGPPPKRRPGLAWADMPPTRAPLPDCRLPSIRVGVIGLRSQSASR